MKFKRLCKGLEDYGTFIPAEDSVFKYIKGDSDHYLSVYEYTKEQKELAEQSIEKDGKTRPRGVSGINDVLTKNLIFDFDIPKGSGLTLEDVKVDTKEAIDRLKNFGFTTKDMQITFSGSKGFGVLLNLNEYLEPDEHKRIARKVTEGLKSWDSKVYNASRILRVPLTKHQTSGLYKTPLDLSELDESIDTIKGFAKNSMDSADLPDWDNVVTLPIKVKELGIKEEMKKTTKTLGDILDLDLKVKPKGLSNWKFALLNGYFPPGTRNDVMMILAATFKAQGYPKEVTGRMLKGAAELQAERFDQEKFEGDVIWGNQIKQVYHEFWNGGTYAEDNFSDELKEYLTELGVERVEEGAGDDSLVVGIEDQFKLFDEYAYKIDENTMKSGIPSLDKKLKMQLGQLIGLLAPPGVGKTSMALTLLNNTSKMGINSFFGSYDMSGNILFQKLIQREVDVDRETLYDAYRNKDYDTIGNFKGVLAENYKNVTFSFNVGQTIQGLKNSITKREEKLGHPIKLVVVDYLELILTKSSDPTQASAEAIQGLREIANEGRVVLVLLQPNKMNSKVDEPLLSYNASKGSSSIAQACTAMITCHRPGMSSQTPETDNFFSINCVKNRMGELFALDFGWVGRTGRITEMDDAGKSELKDLRSFKRAQNEDDDDF